MIYMLFLDNKNRLFLQNFLFVEFFKKKIILFLVWSTMQTVFTLGEKKIVEATPIYIGESTTYFFKRLKNYQHFLASTTYLTYALATLCAVI